jgi:hypothetical protein
MDRNRHQPASKVAVLADLRGVDAVAENCPSELIDALAVRSYPGALVGPIPLLLTLACPVFDLASFFALVTLDS